MHCAIQHGSFTLLHPRCKYLTIGVDLRSSVDQNHYTLCASAPLRLCGKTKIICASLRLCGGNFSNYRLQVRISHHKPLGAGIFKVNLDPGMGTTAFQVDHHAFTKLGMHDPLANANTVY